MATYPMPVNVAMYPGMPYQPIPQKLHRQKYHVSDTRKQHNISLDDSTTTIEGQYKKPSHCKRLSVTDTQTHDEDCMVCKVESMPDISFPSSMSNDSLLGEAMETPSRMLHREDDIDIEAYIKNTPFLMDDD